MSDEHSRDAEEQFALLVTRQSCLVFRVAHTVTRNVHDAEDVVQETFLKLYRTGAWKTMLDEKAFLATAAWRMAVDSCSRKTRTEQPDASIHLQADDPELQALKSDTNRLVHALIDGLPDELRLPLALASLEELSSTEIAALMNIPEGTVRSRTARARELLKEKLQHVFR